VWNEAATHGIFQLTWDVIDRVSIITGGDDSIASCYFFCATDFKYTAENTSLDKLQVEYLSGDVPSDVDHLVRVCNTHKSQSTSMRGAKVELHTRTFFHKHFQIETWI